MINWINPDALLSARDEVQNLLSASSVEVHASENASIERADSLEVVTEKIAESHPEMIYGRTYSPEQLLGGMNENTRKTSFSVTPYENRIIIPRINKNVPLVDVSVEAHADFDTMHEVFMEELKKGVVRYPGTAEPGQIGNAFIFGHSSNYPWIQSEYNDVFALLDQLQKDDEIIVYYQQKKYTYRVTDRVVVKPGDVKALEGRDPTKKELSLMTCWPIGTTLERMILFAELQEN